MTFFLRIKSDNQKNDTGTARRKARLASHRHGLASTHRFASPSFLHPNHQLLRFPTEQAEQPSINKCNKSYQFGELF